MQILQTILFVILVRWAVSKFSYSGENKPPMFGDYEAQRHWMEITYNLNISQWYINSTDNDLLYWGLDYPPLTAYHSYLNGYIANYINSEWVKLNESRGFESYYHKIFMRSSVLILDILIYISGTLIYWLSLNKELSLRERNIMIFFNLFYPGLILIDHGHFQYNCISLGFTIWAVYFLMKSRVYLGSFAFCLALNYKQMSMYHSLPFFFYLLGLTFKEKTFFRKLKKLFLLGFIVLFTFSIVWYPFFTQIQSVLNRIFPVYRDLFEDKVANFWCLLDVLFKIKKTLNKNILCPLIVTSLALIPSCFDLLKNPSFYRFKYALVNSSLAFFLFSYHVHEKQILLPALAVSLTLDRDFYFGVLFYIVSTFSMLPLFIKDEIILPYIILMIMFLLVSSFFIDKEIELLSFSNNLKFFFKFSYYIIISGCVLFSNIQLFYEPPKKYPDLFTLFNAAYSCALFLIFFIYFNYRQFTYKEISKVPIISKFKLE